MQKPFLAIFFLIVCCQLLIGQKKCNCRETADSILNSLTVNYIDRDNLQTNNEFLRLKNDINTWNLNTFSDSCFLYLFSVIASTKDKHIGFRVKQDSAFSYTYATPKIVDLLYNKFKKKKAKSGITGLWELNQGAFRYIVVKSKTERNKYDVIVWSALNGIWSKGDLKGSIYRLSNNTFLYKSFLDKKTATCFLLDWNGKNFFAVNTGKWEKPESYDRIAQRMNLTSEVKELSNGDVYLKMPSFLLEYKSAIDSLIAVNFDKIINAEHLIIDVRNNLGGSKRTYSEVLKFLYTNPILIEGAWFISTHDIIRIMKKSMASYAPGTPLNEYYKYRIPKMEQKLGHMFYDTAFFINYDTTFPKPFRVSILTNRSCGSACELFLISAKQSKKVTIFGEPTSGTIDRADAYTFDCGCSNLEITIPIAKRNPESYKNQIDNIGIPPDVRIPTDEDWEKHVNKYYNRKTRQSLK